MLGADKGLLELGGRRLVDHAIDRLAPQVATVIISANRNADRYRERGRSVVGDQADDFRGPLAGWHAGMLAASTRWVASVPCDAPFFPDDLVARLAAADSSAPARLVVTAEGRQPVFALLDRNLLPRIEAALEAGDYGLGRWLTTVGAIEVLFADTAAFTNLNDPDALRRTEERLGAGGGTPKAAA